MARSKPDVGALFELMVTTGLGTRAAARHLHIPEGTAGALVYRERREPGGGRLATYVKRLDACPCESCVAVMSSRKAERRAEREAAR